MRQIIAALCTIFTATALWADTMQTASGPVEIRKVVGGLNEPWAVDHLPDGRFLVTERSGRLLFVDDKGATVVRGVPEVRARGQGGLLDVAVARDFATSGEVFLTYVRPQSGTGSTALAVARFDPDASRLSNLRVLFTAFPAGGSDRHFGSRVIEAKDGTLFVTLGERGNRMSAQDLSVHNGSVIRINRDGSVPAGNPFAGTSSARPEIWSYGHRNIQGAALDAQGQLWTVEHGAKGGDEVNKVRKGANYGWPVISYGRHYSGAKIGEGTAKPGMEQPAHYWDPSIAPSGMMIYSGKLWPQWRGDMFVGSLKFNHISRLSGAPLREVDELRSTATARVRDVTEAPDGSIWFISVGRGAIYRMTPG
ncbi:PQQ-dependent sugar dehydrogenase [Arenibacterium sp. CAU 1754]